MRILNFNWLVVLCLLFTLTQKLSAQVSEITVQINWTSWASDNSVSVYSPSGELLLFVCDPNNCQTTTTNSTLSNTYNLGCFQDLSNYYIIAADAYGDGWNGTGNFVRVFSGGTQVLNCTLTSGTNSGQQFFNVSVGGSCPTIDVAIESVSGLQNTCGASSVNVSTILRNQGTTSINSIPVYASINGGTPSIVGTYSGNIALGDTGELQFTYNLFGTGIFDFTLYSMLSGDANASNDTNTSFNVSNSNPHDFSAQGPLTMGFENTDDFVGWSTINDNNDGGIWTLNGTTNPRTGSNAAIYNYNVTNSANDWMFTKCLSLVAGQDYNLDFYYRVESGTYPESFSVRLTTAQDNASTIQTFTNITNTAYTLSSSTFTAPSTGEYYIAWYATSTANMWNILIDDISISKNSSIDAGISAITNPTNACGYSANEAVSVVIQNNGSSSISNIPIAYSIDGNAYLSAGNYGGTIASGASANLNFTADLSQTGTHTLSVKTNLSGDEVPGNDSSVVTLIPTSKQLNQVVFSMGFETSENFGEWTILNANGDARQLELTTATPNTGTRSVRIRNTTSTANDWLFTPCISFDAGETYVVDFSYRARTAGFSENFEILLTSATNTTSTVSTIASYNGFGNTSYNNQSLEFTVPSSGVYYVAFRSTSAANQRGMHLDDISIYNKSAYWLGYTTDWNDANNWSSTVPSANSSVVIPINSIGGSMPSVTTNSVVGNLTIQGSADLSISNGVELTVNGDFTGDCLFTQGSKNLEVQPRRSLPEPT